MLCIVKISSDAKITGWIIANDVAEARRMAQGAGDQALAGALYRMEFTPQTGAHELGVGDFSGRYVMLVQ